MISRDTKISKLLKDYPGSLDVLIKTSPHFEKLKNRMLRKALAGRVTIEQAASIAGVDLNNLLLELNKADVHASSANQDFILNETLNDNSLVKKNESIFPPLDPEKIITLDVRPVLESGKDPLQDILSKIKDLKTGEALLIINSFEPIPLYSLLEKKGFSHFTEQEDGNFKVYFYKDAKRKFLESAGNNNLGKIDESSYENIFEIDVHDLQPPEPMMKILENLNKIDSKSVMLVHHHREPVLLYPKLEERGYEAFCEKINDEKYKILIARKKHK